jgi:hypothetical protein
LVSIKAGGTGLNLVAANHVFITDLWWNSAVESQVCPPLPTRLFLSVCVHTVHTHTHTHTTAERFTHFPGDGGWRGACGRPWTECIDLGRRRTSA